MKAFISPFVLTYQSAALAAGRTRIATLPINGRSSLVLGHSVSMILNPPAAPAFLDIRFDTDHPAFRQIHGQILPHGPFGARWPLWGDGTSDRTYDLFLSNQSGANPNINIYLSGYYGSNEHSVSIDDPFFTPPVKSIPFARTTMAGVAHGGGTAFTTLLDFQCPVSCAYVRVHRIAMSETALGVPGGLPTIWIDGDGMPGSFQPPTVIATTATPQILPITAKLYPGRRYVVRVASVLPGTWAFGIYGWIVP